MTPLPPSFLTRPIAHRAFHDRAAGRVENALSSIRAAVSAGYGIEIDIQPAADGTPMVFHDYDLERLTGHTGKISGHSAQALGEMRLLDDPGCIPTLEQVLQEVGGAVPLLIEIKDQDGALGPAVGPLEDAVARALDGYGGDVALMSFNPHSVAHIALAAPDRAVGLTTCAFEPDHWPGIPADRLSKLAGIPDYDRCGASFISHQWRDLPMPRVAELKSGGAAILCWTIRSPEDEATARKIAANVTFEGYAA